MPLFPPSGCARRIHALAPLGLALAVAISVPSVTLANGSLSPADSMAQTGRRMASTPCATVWDSVQIIGNGTVGPYWLTGYFIISGSETVIQQGMALPAIGTYSLDPNRSLIRFSEPVSVNDTIGVRFMRLSWACPTQWALTPTAAPGMMPIRDRRAALAADDAGAIIPVSETTPVPQEAPAPSGFRLPLASSKLKAIEWRGFKSFALRTSSAQSADWSQNLELSVSGEPVRGLKLNAAISDRTASTTDYNRAAGSSRVGDLDRFFIEAQSSSFYGRWGDIMVGGAHATHAAGVKINWRPTDHAVGGYIARASGQLKRRRLPLRPNDAGPYRLVEQTRSTGNVLSGTVTVWFDGHRLREGQSAEYVFDPSQNAITFNPRVTIAPQSVAVVEYEETLDAYQRTLLGADWSWAGSAKRVHNQLSVRWQGDDPQRPLLGRLTESQRQALAGNSGGQITIPASTYSGGGRGDYRLDFLTGGDSVFVYAGPGNGDWRVGFEWVGVNRGRYRHLAESAYEYVGPEKGAFEPTTTLGAPRSDMRVAESVDVGMNRFGRLDGLWLGSFEDANRFSSVAPRLSSSHRLAWTLATGDSDSLPAADGAVPPRQLRFEWRRVRGGEHGDLPVDDLSRFAGTWGLASRLYDSSRSEYQVSASADPAAFVRTETEAGLMQFSGSRVWRAGASTTVQFLKQLSGNLTWRQHAAWRRQSVNQSADDRSALATHLTATPGPFRMTIGWQEDRRENSHRLFEPVPAVVITRWIEAGRGSVLAQYRWETSRDSTQIPPRRTREWSLTAPLDLRDVSHGQMTLARGEQSVGQDNYSPYYSGQLSERWDPSPALTVSADLRLLYGRAGTQQEVYLPTPPGQGQYRLERGEYVPDVHGDYRRVVSMSDDAERSAYDSRQRLSGTWRFQTDGWRWTIESLRERQALHDPKEFRPGVWFIPWTDLGWALAFGARAEQRDYHSITARPNDAMEWIADWTGDRSIFGAGPRQMHDQFGLRARQRISPSLFIQTAAEFETRHRDAVYGAAVYSEGSVLHVTVGGAGQSQWDWSVEARRRSEREHHVNGAPALWGLRPRVRVSYGPLSALMETDGTWVKANQAQGRLSPLLAEGRPAGFSLTEFCEVRYQLRGHLMLTSRLNADMRQHGADRWQWELETTATF